MDSAVTLSDDLMLGFLQCQSKEKEKTLLHFLRNLLVKEEKTLMLVFTATRHHVEYLGQLLTSQNIKAEVIYGSMDQSAPKDDLSRFRRGQTPVLVVTDVAACGIDVPSWTTSFTTTSPLA